MIVAHLVLSVMVLVVGHALAQNRSFAAWLIYPGQKQSPAIDLPTKQGPWQLVRHDRSLIAEMPQPRLRNGYTFNFGECRVNGAVRHDLIAMVRYSKGREWSKDVAAVWVAEPNAERFIARKIEGIECRNEGYGV